MGTLNLHRRVAGWFGYELIKTRKLNDTLPQHLANIVRHCDVNIVIDVGANSGQFAQSLRQHGYSGHIESFEPIRNAFDALENLSAADRDWHCRRLALGSKSCNVTMHRFAATEFSSILRINNYARERFKWRAELDDIESVQMVRLDDVWPEIRRSVRNPRVLLKLDTQGYDLEVLAGSEQVLPTICAIQVELSLRPIYDGAPRYLEALQVLENKGFEISGLYPVSRDKKTLAIVEYDCVMVRA